MYSVKEFLFVSVGFRGYLGGFAARWVISDREFASTCVAMSNAPSSNVCQLEILE